MKRAQNANMVVVNFFSLQISEYSSSKIMSYYIVLACATTATIGHYQAFGYLQCYLCQYCQHLPFFFCYISGTNLVWGIHRLNPCTNRRVLACNDHKKQKLKHGLPTAKQSGIRNNGHSLNIFMIIILFFSDHHIRLQNFTSTYNYKFLQITKDRLHFFLLWIIQSGRTFFCFIR